MLKIGITGGIGSGKSVVCKLLGIYGIEVYDSDKEAKRLMLSDAIKGRIKKELGEESYLENGQINRQWIAQQIFGDKLKLERINKIVHPAVLEDFGHWANRQEENGKNAVGFESAIIYEIGAQKLFDEIWIVQAPKEQRIARACKRDGSDRQKIESRIANQKETEDPDAKKIINDGKQSLIEQTRTALENLGLASGKG